MIITIDGPSGTGKSTVAKLIAKKLGFAFFDTGAMYRALAWHVLQKGRNPADAQQVCAALDDFAFSIETKGAEKVYFVGKTNVTQAIRQSEISTAASQVSVFTPVRRALVKIQRRFGAAQDSVFEGRDMGTVVFPEAQLKIFLTARPDVRAERRYRELLAKFPDLSEKMTREQILREIEERDERDTTRTVSPLKQAPDALLIDTSDLNAEQVVEQILAYKRCRSCRYKPKMKLFYRIIYTLARTFFRTFFRLKVYGLPHFRPGAAIIAANHTSFYDPPVLSISCPEEVHFLAKSELFDVPLLGALIRKLNTHPVSRSGSDAKTFRLLIDLLKAQDKVILFPEGARAWDGELQPLERGLGLLVVKSQCNIIPAYIHGAHEAWPRAKRFPKLWGKMAVVFGSPIEWADYEHLEKGAAMDAIGTATEQSIRNLKSWYDAGANGLPP